MVIGYFVSDHGFGHIMRNISVIKELINRGNQIILVCGEKQINAVKEYFVKLDIVFIPYHTDVGISVKAGTLLLDRELTRKKVDDYILEFPERIKFAEQVVDEYNIERVVVDIVPWALIAAKNKEIPSFLMASFTWVEQYKDFIEKKHVDLLEDAFKTTDSVLYFELANEIVKTMLGDGINVGLTARQFTDEVNVISNQYKKPIVFLSLGVSNTGLDFDINVSDLPYIFISTGVLKLKGDNVIYLDVSVSNTQDYIKAADYCIAKAGWTTVAEMLLADCKFAVLRRPDVPEDSMTISELERKKIAFGIDVEELKDMKSVMDKLVSFERDKKKYTDNYIGIANIIMT